MLKDRNDESYQEVAKVAYEVYIRRRAHGQDLDDWLEAERLVMTRRAEQFQASNCFCKKGNRETDLKSLRHYD